jgi:hypothetical protein
VPDLVVRDAKGDTYTVPYDAVNAMLFNEFLKECRKIDAQVGEIRRGETCRAGITPLVSSLPFCERRRLIQRARRSLVSWSNMRVAASRGTAWFFLSGP